MSRLGVSKLCVSKLCVSRSAGGGRTGTGQAGVQNQKQELHTKMRENTRLQPTIQRLLHGCQSSWLRMLLWHVLSGCDVIMFYFLSFHFSTARQSFRNCDVTFCGSGVIVVRLRDTWT